MEIDRGVLQDDLDHQPEKRRRPRRQVRRRVMAIENDEGGLAIENDEGGLAIDDLGAPPGHESQDEEPEGLGGAEGAGAEGHVDIDIDALMEGIEEELVGVAVEEEIGANDSEAQLSDTTRSVTPIGGTATPVGPGPDGVPPGSPMPGWPGGSPGGGSGEPPLPPPPSSPDFVDDLPPPPPPAAEKKYTGEKMAHEMFYIDVRADGLCFFQIRLQVASVVGPLHAFIG